MVNGTSSDEIFHSSSLQRHSLLSFEQPDYLLTQVDFRTIHHTHPRSHSPRGDTRLLTSPLPQPQIPNQWQAILPSPRGTYRKTPLPYRSSSNLKVHDVLLESPQRSHLPRSTRLNQHNHNQPHRCTITSLESSFIRIHTSYKCQHKWRHLKSATWRVFTSIGESVAIGATID